jgi:hypothetical protein
MGYKKYFAQVYFSEELTEDDRLLLMWNRSTISKSGDLSQAVTQIEIFCSKNINAKHADIAPFLNLIFKKSTTAESTNWAQKYIVAAEFPRLY